MIPRIHKEIQIEAPVEQVWKYVGTQTGLQQWWGAEIRLEEKEGGRCEEMGALDGVPYHRVGKVTIYDPPRQLSLILQEMAGQGWPAYMTISLTLAEANGRTIVTVVQQALGFVQSRSGATPSGESEPQSEFHPPLLQMVAERAVTAADASTYGSLSGSSLISVLMMRGHASVGDGAQPHESLWRERLEALKQKSQTT